MALTQTQVSQLYVSIFGRASEGAGNTYWQAQTDLTTAAANMLATEAAATYFDSNLDTDQAFIEHIYLNTLGKTYAEDTEGVDYWVSLLEGGKSRGEVVAALIEAAQSAENAGPAQDMFNNKVAVSDYVADTIETADLADLSAFTNFIKDVDNTSSSVDSAKADVDVEAAKLDTGMLTTSLATLDAANAALDDYLKNIDMNADGKADKASTGDVDTNLSSKVTAVEAAIDGYTGSNKTIQGYGTNDTFTNVSDSIKLNILSEVETALDATVTSTAAKVNETKGLMDKAKTLSSAEEAYNSAVDKFTAAAKSFKAEASKFNVENGSGAIDTLTDFSSITNVAQLATAVGAAIAEDDGALVIAAGSEEKVGIDALLASAKALYSAMKAEDNAKVTLESAIDAVLKAENTAADYNAELKTSTVTITTAHTLDNATAKEYTLTIGDKTYTVSIAADAADTDAAAIAGLLVAKVNDATVATNSGAAITITGFANDAIKATEPTSDTVATAKDITPAYAGNGNITDYYTALTDTDVVGAAGAKHDAAVNLSTGTITADSVSAYNEAVAAVEAFDKANTEYVEAKGYADEKDALVKAVDDAKAAIKNPTDDKDAPGLGLDLITIEDDATTATNPVTVTADAKNNVFLLNIDEAANVTISNFGDAGLDRLFIGEESYSLVAMGKDETTKDSLGSVSDLEIFWKQSGDDLILYIENETFAGNGSSEADLVKITLTGTTSDDISLVNGFISAGEIA